MHLTFHVIALNATVPKTVGKSWRAYLNRDFWDDWGKYCTQFRLTLVDGQGDEHKIGQVKIGQIGLQPHARANPLPPRTRQPDMAPSFQHLSQDHFSLGQDDDYYASLTKLPDDIRTAVLVALRDIAFDSNIWNIAQDEMVTAESLLRSVTTSTATGQFARMAKGDARLTPFRFTYSPPTSPHAQASNPDLSFEVDPESALPTNIHVLIGRNGVGKTRLLSLMAKALVGDTSARKSSGNFDFSATLDDASTFANVVSVSFSAFEHSVPIRDTTGKAGILSHSFIGLRQQTDSSSDTHVVHKSTDLLAEDFVLSLQHCSFGSRRRRWECMIATLESDPVFLSANFRELLPSIDSNKKEAAKTVTTVFNKLSSGHKLVLLTLTRLVEKVEEKTLVLLDEPEAHLHPPLLSAMVRAISVLMVQRNGVAIVATHSPVVLQEVPRSCVWILNRTLNAASVHRPEVETFAESIGILSREVFQLELSRSGYRQILRSLRDTYSTYSGAIFHIDGQMGGEGKAILRSMYLDDDEPDHGRDQ